jgi:hypothetical protein
METQQGAAAMNAIKGVEGLFADVNKEKGTPGGPKVADEYTSKMSDSEILSLTSAWTRDYAGYYANVEKSQEKAFNYWLGKQKVTSENTLEDRDMVVNHIFKAVETFLPIATRANPDPVVKADGSPEGQALANDVKEALVHLADEQKLRRKLARMTRLWTLDKLGVLEIEYDVEIDDIKITAFSTKDLIFDKDGTIDESGFFTGSYIGHKIKKEAGKLMQMFPDHKELIMTLSNGRKGTKIEYVKWYYRGRDVFFTIGTEYVLGKFMNPHWNYDGQVERQDENGTMIIEEVVGKNHFKRPLAPYVFLSVFSIGKHPHDDTSLILQNINQQDQINKIYRQLDSNIEKMNNGLIINGNLMTDSQAAQAAGAMQRGASIRVMGDVNAAVGRPLIPALPNDVRNGKNDMEQELDSIFGIQGSTPQGIASEETARGKIMVSQSDSSRIGGGITEAIEQVADSVYNWMAQMMIVHYDTEHYIGTVGAKDGQEAIMLINSRFQKTLTITVKEGSLIPKDPLTQRNEAVDLWSQNAIDPLSLYKKLDFPDPNAAATSLILWQMLQKGQITPEMYLPGFQTPQQAPQALPPTQGTGGPAVNSMNGTDVGQQAPSPGTQSAEQAQSKQLLQSVKI